MSDFLKKATLGMLQEHLAMWEQRKGEGRFTLASGSDEQLSWNDGWNQAADLAETS